MPRTILSDEGRTLKRVDKFSVPWDLDSNWGVGGEREKEGKSEREREREGNESKCIMFKMLISVFM